jgi:hypothetical protein
LPAATGVTLDAMAFFTGQSEGEGTLDTLVKSPVKIAVTSTGKRQGDTLVLDQVIRTGAKPPRMRRWTMWRVAPGRFTGTLTDAAGPVEVRVAGARARIRYTLKKGLNVEQQLALQSDGRTILNRLQVTKFGLRVATLKETIRKRD